MPSVPSPAFLSTQVTASNRFWLQPPHHRSQRLAVICGGWEQCSADYGIDRATFIIDPDGKIARVFPKVTPAGHSMEILNALKELKSR